MTSYTGYGTADPGGSYDSGDSSAYTLGVCFKATAAGCTLSKIRIFPSASGTGTLTGWQYALYDSGSGYPTGSALASGSFGTITRGAWNEASLSYALTANNPYYACVWLPAFNYEYILNEFSSAIVNGPLTLVADSTSTHNGVYHPGSSLALPNGTFSASSYCIDVQIDQGGTDVALNPASELGSLGALLPQIGTPVAGVSEVDSAISLLPQIGTLLGGAVELGSIGAFTVSGGGSVSYTGSKNDIIMQELIAAGFVTGTIADREYERLMAATGDDGVGETLYDMYYQNGERPRL